MKSVLHSISGSMLLAVVATAGPAAAAQPAAEWAPTRPIRFISTFPAGGSVDSVARVLAQRLGDALGQQVVVDNRGGASGMVGVELTIQAPPDGHTMVIAANSLTIYRVIQPELRFDPMKELAPVSLVASAPLVLCTPPSLPVANGRELIAYVKARPGKLNFSSSGNGTSSHLAGELFKTMAGLDMAHIPYKGAAPAITDLMSGQVQVMFSSTLSMVPLVQGGKLRGLGVSSAKRLAVLPDMPAVAEFLPGYELSPWFGVFVPVATPKPIIARLNRELARVLQRQDVQDFYARQGAVPVYNTPEEFAAFTASEGTKWGALIRKTGVKPE
ncbi:MAG: tripartite tricarboxylate transporter substrate binding protein [Burkholderiales bacterium]